MRHAAAAAAAVALCVVVLAAPQAQAGNASFGDAAGDATGIDPMPPTTPSVGESTPRTSEPELDLTRVAVNSDGVKVSFVATIGKSGIPATAHGTTFRFWFTYDKLPYQLIAQRPNDAMTAVTTTGVFFRARAVTSPELACRDCAVRYDLKANTVTVSASLAGLSAGIRQSKPGTAPLGAGKSLTELAVLAQRLVLAADRTVDVGRTVTVDVARGGAATLAL